MTVPARPRRCSPIADVRGGWPRPATCPDTATATAVFADRLGQAAAGGRPRRGRQD